MIENDAEMWFEPPSQPRPPVFDVASPEAVGAEWARRPAEPGPRLRAGRKNPRNLYLQMGAEPDDEADLPIGYFIDSDVAALIGEGLTSPWHLNEIRLTAEGRADEPRRGR